MASNGRQILTRDGPGGPSDSTHLKRNAKSAELPRGILRDARVTLRPPLELGACRRELRLELAHLQLLHTAPRAQLEISHELTGNQWQPDATRLALGWHSDGNRTALT